MKMSDPLSAEAGTIVGKAWSAAVTVFPALGKLVPAAAGATLMILVKPPKTNRERFTRYATAFLMSHYMGMWLFDLLSTFSSFAFLDRNNELHIDAIKFMVGATGYFLIGGIVVALDKFRKSPFKIISDVKGVMKP